MKVTVPEYNVSRLVAGLGKLVKRATKLGVEPPTWTVGEPFVKEYGEVDPDTKKRPSMKFCEVDVEGKAPKFEGWRLIAVVASLGEGNVIRSVPGEEVPESYRTAPIACDHCRLTRSRLEVFVVAHDDGTFKLVGRSCLKDFLGHKSPEALAAGAEVLFEIDALCREAEDFEGGGGRGGYNVAPLVDFLAMTACIIRRDGWMSRGLARDLMKTATADTVWSTLNPDSYLLRHWRENPGSRPVPTPEDEKLAGAAAEWAVGLTENASSDYLWNVRLVARFGHVGYKEGGIAASIVSAYNKEVGNEIERKRLETSVAFGEPGKRLDLTLTLLSRHDIEGMYGLTRIHRFLTPDGNVAVWFASAGRTLGEVGETWKVKATVKKHATRNGITETVVTRVKAVGKVEEVPVAA